MNKVDFAAQLQAADNLVPVETNLTTDQQVIAKVTDGIYRNPVSAFRELLANAYDADATEVRVSTDEPRFDRITFTDNGNGMSIDALDNLLHHIGGSAKRSPRGEHLGISKSGSSHLSPGNRRLIGRIGIGLFSVSHLTRRFQIVTKRKGDDYHIVASVVLRQFDGEVSDSFESGKVKVWKEANRSLDSSGTTIILDGVREEAKELLSSKHRWLALREAYLEDPTAPSRLKLPEFYIGFTETDSIEGESYSAIATIDGKQPRSVPWEDGDAPKLKFEKLYTSVLELASSRTATNIRLDDILDEYFKLVWQLSLSLPLSYLGEDPFDYDWSNANSIWHFDHEQGRLTQMEASQASVREQLGLSAPVSNKFRILVDDIELSRPLKFNDLPKSNNAIEDPIVVFGQYEHSETQSVAPFSGGQKLRFHSYFLWNPKVVPVEHQGVLLRIHDSSGTLFDQTFLNYQTAELVRLRQITAEVFIQEGFEGAVNIDRESLNISHPHYVLIAQYVHSVLKSLASKQKSIAAAIRSETRARGQNIALTSLDDHVAKVRERLVGSGDGDGKAVSISSSLVESSNADIVILPDELPEDQPQRVTEQYRDRVELRRKATEAIGEVLSAYGVFQVLDSRLHKTLLLDIYAVLRKLEKD